MQVLVSSVYNAHIGGGTGANNNSSKINSGNIVAQSDTIYDENSQHDGTEIHIENITFVEYNATDAAIGPELYVLGSNFSHNVVHDHGGVIGVSFTEIDDSENVTSYGCTFDNNSANYAGGIWQDESLITLQNHLFTKIMDQHLLVVLMQPVNYVKIHMYHQQIIHLYI